MVCHLNLCIKKWGSPCSFRKKSPFISVNNPVFIENLQVPSTRLLVPALITQKMMRRKDAQSN